MSYPITQPFLDAVAACSWQPWGTSGRLLQGRTILYPNHDSGSWALRGSGCTIASDVFTKLKTGTLQGNGSLKVTIAGTATSAYYLLGDLGGAAVLEPTDPPPPPPSGP